MNAFTLTLMLGLCIGMASGGSSALRGSSTSPTDEVAQQMGTTTQQVSSLIKSIDGEVMTHYDPEFNATAKEEFFLPPWQSPKKPVVVVLVNHSKDLRTVVAWAKHNAVSLSPAAGRHGSAGYCLKASMTIDFRRMKDLELDEDSLTLKAGAGVLLGDIIDYLNARGYVTATGVCEKVGLSGWTLGGGYGPFSKLMGLGVDNVQEMEVVLANGTQVMANNRSHTDLFWALRGAGHQSFGFVASYVIKVKPLQSFVYWNVDIPMEASPELAAKVLSEWKRLYYTNQTWMDSVVTTYSVRFGRKTANAQMVMNFEMLWPADTPTASDDLMIMLAPLTDYIDAHFGNSAIAEGPSVKKFDAIKTFDDAFSNYIKGGVAEGKVGLYLKNDITDLSGLVRAALSSLELTKAFPGELGFYMVLEPYVGATIEPAAEDTAFSHRGNVMGDFYIDFFVDLDTATHPEANYAAGMHWLQSFYTPTDIRGSPFIGDLLERYFTTATSAANTSAANDPTSDLIDTQAAESLQAEVSTFTAYQNYKQMAFGEGASGKDASDVLSRWPALLNYYSRNLCRLIEVKREYDPQLVFDFAQGIPLEAPPGACTGA
jgi:hypothetical protein